MEKERKVKKYALVALIIAIIGLTVAFAALSQELNISGSGKVDPALWDIYFDNLSEPTIKGKASVREIASIENKTTLNINVNLLVPNDSVEYTVNLVNNGDVNAEIGSIDVSLTEEQKKYVDFSMKYEDTSLGEVAVGDILLAKTTSPTTLPIKITIKYKDITASELPKENLNIGFTYALNFVQTSKTEFPSKTTTTKPETYAIGTRVCMEKPLQSECFYVINDDGTTITALAEYNINDGGIQNSDNPTYSFSFSDSNYWEDSNGLLTKYGTSYPAYVYDSNSNVKNKINFFESMINDYFDANIRLLTYEESASLGCGWNNNLSSQKCDSSSQNWLYSSTFITGSLITSTDIFTIDSDGNIYGSYYETLDSIGIRPVIETARYNVTVTPK